MTTVGFVGGGRIVETVARLSVAAGHRVVLSDSRGPEAVADLVRELGPLISAATAEEAAEAGEIVDAGPLAESWRQEPGTPVFRSPYGSLSDRTGTPAGAAKIRAALAAARVALPTDQ
jgi:predicted dinucleotide-binding enzyme